MSDHVEFSEEDTRRLVVAITDFLREQLSTREDFVPEDRDCLEIAIQCLEMAYGLDPNGYIQLRFARPLLDIFAQVTNPVSVRDKLRAEAHKDDGNNFMRRRMFENAESEYTAAIELDKWNSIYYCNRAGARIELQNYFEAITDCRQALMLNPDYAKAHGRMGQAYALLQRPREAARCFRQAVELDPGNERYANNLRVAESLFNRSDAVGLITNLLSSLFGMTIPNLTRGNTNTNNAPSFVIITENTPHRRHTTPRNVQLNENTSAVNNGRDAPVSESQNTVYPLPYAGNEEEQPILQTDTVENNENDTADRDQEFIIEFPGFVFFQEVDPPPQPSQQGRQDTFLNENQEQMSNQTSEKSSEDDEIFSSTMQPGIFSSNDNETDVDITIDKENVNATEHNKEDKDKSKNDKFEGNNSCETERYELNKNKNHRSSMLKPEANDITQTSGTNQINACSSYDTKTIQTESELYSTIQNLVSSVEENEETENLASKSNVNENIKKGPGNSKNSN